MIDGLNLQSENSTINECFVSLLYNEPDSVCDELMLILLTLHYDLLYADVSASNGYIFNLQKFMSISVLFLISDQLSTMNNDSL